MKQKLIRFGKKFITYFVQADVVGYAAQIAYFLLLSLFPFLFFITTLLGYLPIESYSLLDMLRVYLPDDVMTLIETNLTDLAENRSGGLLSVGIIGTLWAASKGVNAITKSLNRAYGEDSKRLYLIDRIIAIGLTLGMIFVIVIALLLPVLGEIIGEFFFTIFNVSEELIISWHFFRYLISSIIFFMIFFFLYLVAPQTKVKVRHASLGALFTTFALQAVSFGFSFFVNRLEHFSATYGSLGAVIILMIWFYLVGIIINAGGVLNASLRELDNNRS